MVSVVGEVGWFKKMNINILFSPKISCFWWLLLYIDRKIVEKLLMFETAIIWIGGLSLKNKTLEKQC